MSKKITFLLISLFMFSSLLSMKSLRGEEVVTNQVLVKFKPIATEEIFKIHQQNKAKVIKEIKVLRIYQVEISTETTLEETIKKYKENPNVIYAEPNFVGKTFATIPNDLHFNKQWAVKKTELDKAWDLGKGGPEIVVAVLDSGVDLNHPDLKENLIPGYDFINDDPEPMDDNGHGTLVAGVIAAKGENGEGIAGVSWYSKIMPIKVVDSQGSGHYFNLAQGIIYAVENGAKIVNLSVGGYTYSEALKEIVDYALSQGCIIVAGVGDDNFNIPVFPAAYPGVIGVGATGEKDEVSTDSNYGGFLDLYAPGKEIYSTLPGSQYGYGSGSSLAAAYVSGLVALLISADQSLGRQRIEEILYATGDYIPDKFKGNYGHGRTNAYRAMTVVKGINTVDLAIVDLKVIPEKPLPGQETEITVSLQNQGNVETGATALRLYISGYETDVVVIPALAPNQVITKKFKWIPRIVSPILEGNKQ